MKIIRRESFREDEESEWDQKQLIPFDELGENGDMIREMIELFSVRIVDFVGDVYGTITISDGLTTQYLFNRKREEAEFIGPDNNNTVLLIGPAEPIPGNMSFTFYVNLVGKDGDLPLVSNGIMCWVCLDTTGNVYDEPVREEIENFGDGTGSVILDYIVLTDAVVATVEVTLMIKDGEDPAHVYGLITAGNDNFSEESVLFRKGSNEHIDVRSGRVIPLSRSVVVVPLQSYLIVRADLSDYNAIPSNVIANGTAEFGTKFFGTDEERICGPCSEILVKVTWT